MHCFKVALIVTLCVSYGVGGLRCRCVGIYPERRNLDAHTWLWDCILLVKFELLLQYGCTKVLAAKDPEVYSIKQCIKEV